MNKVTDKQIVLDFYTEHYKEWTPTKEALSRTTYYGLYSEGDLVGLVGVVSHFEKIAEISQFVVDRTCRHLGYGTKLYSDLEKQLKEEGYHKIIAWILTNNHESLFPALKNGYLIEGLTRNNLPGVSAYVCGKVL